MYSCCFILLVYVIVVGLVCLLYSFVINLFSGDVLAVAHAEFHAWIHGSTFLQVLTLTPDTPAYPGMQWHSSRFSLYVHAQIKLCRFWSTSGYLCVQITCAQSHESLQRYCGIAFQHWNNKAMRDKRACEDIAEWYFSVERMLLANFNVEISIRNDNTLRAHSPFRTGKR